MSARAATYLAWTLAVVYIVLSASGLYLQFLADSTPVDRAFPLLLYLIVMVVVGVWPIIGAKIISRFPLHPVGWLLFATFPLVAFVMFAIGYASYATTIAPELLPVPAALLFWLKDPGMQIAVVMTTLLYLLFPGGKFASRGWRAVGLLSLAALPFYIALQMIRPGPLINFPSLDNPDAVSAGAWTSLEPLYLALAAILMLCSLAAVVSLFVRLRRSSGDEAQQIKWLIIPAVIYWIGIPVFHLADYLQSQVLLDAGIALHLIAVPALVMAALFAIFKYRLYDIDFIISRTLLYGALTAVLAAAYLLVVAVFGSLFQAQGELTLALVATGLIAILFQPLRQRLQRAVNRLVYGRRDEPFEALSHLGRRLQGLPSPDMLYAVIVETVAEALKLPYASLTVRRGDTLETAESYGSPSADVHAYPLLYQGQTIGELRVCPRGETESFSAADERLLRNFARQVGPAVYAAELFAALQLSRQQLVSAREEERRRLRRDLHDGLGPALASVVWQSEAAHDLIAADPHEAAAMLQNSVTQARATLSDIRRLVYELRPPALDELGLVGALEQAARQQPHMQVAIDAPETLPPLPAAVEVAAFRITQEALKNAVDHGHAAHCRVSLALNGGLALAVRDDGAGLLPDHATGVGLLSMRERAEELGGAFRIRSRRAGGTAVEVTLPLGKGA